jgi:pimeloyl-ACP methyl ester carboxylesterase
MTLLVKHIWQKPQMALISLAVIGILINTTGCGGASNQPGSSPTPPQPVKKLILPGEVFILSGRVAFITWPETAKRQTPQPWVFYAPTLPTHPDIYDKWMHEQFLQAGIAVAGIDVGESYGSPEGTALLSAFYNEVTRKRGFARRPCLLSRSRGGLIAANWAIENPFKVAGFAGIYPVFDFRSFPGVEKAAPAYHLTPEQLSQRAAQFNPIQRLKSLTQAKVPAYLIHGDNDIKVPLNANSAAFAARYRADGAGEVVTLVIAPGQGHSFWEGFFHHQPLVDFVIARAKRGASS